MYYTIYKTTNLANGKIYIGKHQTTDLNDGYLGSGKLLKRAIEKYGVNNFKKEILFVFDNESDMNAKETELVTSDYLLDENTYNLCVGGQGGFSYINGNGLNLYGSNTENLIRGKLDSTKIIEKIKEAGKYSEFCENISKGMANKYKEGWNPWLNKNHKEETKRKISESLTLKQSGNKNSQYGTMWITNGTENKKIKKDLDTIPDGWYKGRVTWTG